MEEFTVAEVEGFVEVCWTLSPPDISFQRTVEFNITSMPGSASESDYTRVDLILQPQSQDVCINASISSDSAIENQEDFFLMISTSDPSVHVTTNSSMVRVVITDSTLIVLVFEEQAYQVPENGSRMVCVGLGDGLGLDRGLNFSFKIESLDSTVIPGKNIWI